MDQSQNSPYVITFADGFQKIYPPTTDPVALKQMADEVQALKALHQAKSPFDALGSPKPDIPPDVTYPKAPPGPGPRIGPDPAYDPHRKVDHFLEDVGETVQLGAGMMPLLQGTKAISFIPKAMQSVFSRLPVRMLGTGIGGAIESAGKEENPLKGALEQALLEGVMGGAGDVAPRLGLNIGSAFGGVEPSARRSVVEAHLGERARKFGGGLPLGSVERAQSRQKEVGDAIKATEAAIPGRQNAALMQGAANREIPKSQVAGFTRGSAIASREDANLTQAALRRYVEDHIPGGMNALTGLTPEQWSKLEDFATNLPPNLRQELVNSTQFTASDLGNMSRELNNRSRDLIRARGVGAAQHVEDDVRDLVDAAQGARAKQLRNELGSRTPPPGPVTTVPGTVERSASAPGVNERLNEITQGTGLGIPGEPRRMGFQGRINEPPRQLPGNAPPPEPPVVDLPNLTDEPPIHVDLGKTLEDLDKRYRDLKIIEETGKGMRGGGTTLTTMGPMSVRGGFASGVGRNLAQVGGIPMGLAPWVGLLGSLGLSPAMISRMGFMGGHLADILPSFLRGSELIREHVPQEPAKPEPTTRRRKPQ